MQYQKPGFIMKIASADFVSERVGVNYLLKMREEANRWLLRNIAAKPSASQILAASALIEKVSGIALDEQQLWEILALFPVARIELAVYGVENLETQDNLMDAISNFFLGCTWPRMGDDVDMKKFVLLLRRQSAAMGYGSSASGARVNQERALGGIS